MKIEEKDQTKEHKKMFELSDKLVKELKESDIIIISAPIYNYGPPATLKAWSDLAARIGETFKFKPNGRREGLLKNKQAYLVITSGGTKLNSSEDFLTPWLKFILWLNFNPGSKLTPSLKWTPFVKVDPIVKVDPLVKVSTLTKPIIINTPWLK